MRGADERNGNRTRIDPYTAYELPSLAARGIAHAYVALPIGMPLLFALEWLARRGDYADDSLGDAALRCLVPAALGLVLALASRRSRVAQAFPFAQGLVLSAGIAGVLGFAASATGGMQSPYLVSMQTMLFLWGLIMPGGSRLAALPILVSLALFFAVLAAKGAPIFASTRDVLAFVFTITGGVLSLAYAEVSERRRRAVWTASSIDSLSRLSNRRHLLERFEELCARATSRGAPISVLLFDIDRFKRINDSHGHAAGDVVIRAVAGMLLESSRATDLSGRLGGEEFVVVLDDADSEVAAAVAERIRASVEAARFLVEAGELAVTLSVGISTQPGGEQRSIDELLREADAALYESKREGRNRITLFSARAPS